jgi:hypothetical protein
MQTAFNVRQFKYNNLAKNVTSAVIKKTIDITQGQEQWNEVDVAYRFIGSTNYGRDYRGAVPSLRYTTPVPVNSLQEVKITSDNINIYFYIRTDGDIVMNGKNNCMNLFIGLGTPSLKGFESYEYVLNRNVNGNKTTVERLKADYSGSPVGEAEISVNGSLMQIAIPKSTLSLENNNKFYFKVADSVENPSDIMDYYVSGRCMPMGRFSYQYVME